MPTVGNPKVIFVAQNQAFEITVYGLVPLTRHYVYFERQQQAAASLAPQGGAVGQALISDLNGKLTFTYYYNSGLPTETSSLEQAKSLANSVAGIKELVVTNVSQTQLSATFQATAISYAKTFIVVQVFLPSKAELDANPLGSIEGSFGVLTGV